MPVTKLNWVDSLPPQLKAGVIEIVKQNTASVTVLDDLYNHLVEETESKRRKVSTPQDASEGSPSTIKMLSDYSIQINRKILEEETIFEIPQISFQSPIRKKMNLLLHLLPENGGNPILLIINIASNEPEMSFIQLDKSIKLCVLLPILGMSTVEAKKNIGSLCFWLNEKAMPDATKNDPIICQINLDLVKKHLIKTGKIPATAESQMLESTQLEGIKPINEAIIVFLTRQFKLCGIDLINYLPSCDINKNKLAINNDTGVVISHKANNINDMVIVEAYKGSKDGSLMLFNKNQHNPAYLGFGFKKPILLYRFDEVTSYSFSDITKRTFTVRFDIKNDKKEKPDVLEFSMIDQQYYGAIDDFLKLQDISNNSFDESLREKPANEKSNGAREGQSQEELPGQDGDDDDEEEEDGNYQGGEEEEDEDDVAEEYDSDAEGTDNEEDDTHQVAKEEDEEEGNSQGNDGVEGHDSNDVVVIE